MKTSVIFSTFHISALDPYAVITYIVSYISKDETNMTEALKDILFKTKHLTKFEQLTALKTAWMKLRQIGASEAVYRLLSGLKLKSSNIACVFVASGFFENRSVFFQKIDEKADKIDSNMSGDEDEEDLGEVIDEPDVDNDQGISIAGREGKFKVATTVHDRYQKRPNYLEKMSLGQFATVYVLCPRTKKGTEFYQEGPLKNCSEEESEITIFGSETKIPQYIDLRNYKLGTMRARSFPAVLRIHSSFKKDKDAEEGDEQYFSELLMYFPWRNEDDLKAKCKKDPTEEDITIINNIKQALYLGLSTGDLLELSETWNIGQEKPTHVYDTLDPQREQDAGDDDNEGIEEDPEFAARLPDKNMANETDSTTRGESTKFKKLLVPDDEELLNETRKLVPEQLEGLAKAVRYCKELKRNRKDPTLFGDPLKLIIHGGAGM